MKIADFAFWTRNLDEPEIRRLRKLKGMSEVDCYNRLYNDMAMLVPHYKWRHWHHVAVSFDGDKIVTWIDGKEDKSGAFTVSFWHKREK